MLFCEDVGMKFLIFSILFLLLLATPLLSDSSSMRGIISTGNAEVKGQPDIARVTISVVTQSKDQGQAVANNAKTMTAVRESLMTKFKLRKKDIETSFYGIQPQYDYKVQPPKIVGYQVTNSARVSIKDLEKIGQLIDAASAAGANQIGGISFDIEDDKPLRNEALVLALTEARQKAELMAKTLNVSLGPLLSVQESFMRPMPFQSFARADVMAASTPETPIQAQELSISANVTVIYDIK